MYQMTNELAPAIPLDQIYPALEFNVLGPTKIRPFCQNDEFRSFPYPFQQITSVVKFSEDHYQTIPSNRSLARLFEVHPTIVTRALKHGYTVPYIHAKAGLLPPIEEDAIIQWITLNSQKVKHTPRSQILSYATETFKKFSSRWASSRQGFPD
jgi:DNA-binding transcriptional regulator YhcF (GntR family)